MQKLTKHSRIMHNLLTKILREKQLTKDEALEVTEAFIKADAWNCYEAVNNHGYKTYVPTLVVDKSSNTKTGDMTTTYTQRSETCATNCPFNNGNGCYGDSFRLAMQDNRFGNSSNDASIHTTVLSAYEALRNAALRQLLSNLKQGDSSSKIYARLNIAGDFAIKGTSELDYVTLCKTRFITNAVYGLLYILGAEYVAYSYTHCNQDTSNDVILRNTALYHLIINYSCETITQVIGANRVNVPSVIVSTNPEQTIATLKAYHGIKAVKCRNQTESHKTCKECGLCAIPERKFPVVIKVHGNKAAKAAAVIDKLNSAPEVNIKVDASIKFTVI